MTDWMSFIRANWNGMPPSAPLWAPAGLPHPALVGFSAITLAEGVGQVADWVLRFTDGSRVHVHECADGSFRVHRDRWDPENGPIDALLHFFLETKTGKALGFTAVTGAALWGVSRLD